MFVFFIQAVDAFKHTVVNTELVIVFLGVFLKTDPAVDSNKSDNNKEQCTKLRMH